MNSKKVPARSHILTDANDLIIGERAIQYGEPSENFQRIADFWGTYLSHHTHSEVVVTPRMVAEMMILLKLARSVVGVSRDSFVDIAGYSAIGYEVGQDEEFWAE